MASKQKARVVHCMTRLAVIGLFAAYGWVPLINDVLDVLGFFGMLFSVYVMAHMLGVFRFVIESESSNA